MSKDNDFCNNLKRLRLQYGFTQSELEIKSELPLMVISQYETGSRKPGLDNIKLLCKGLGCTASELLGI